MYTRHQRGAIKIYKSALAAKDVLPANGKERIGDHLCSGRRRISAIKLVPDAVRAEKQLVGDELTGPVEYRLPGDKSVHRLANRHQAKKKLETYPKF